MRKVLLIESDGCQNSLSGVLSKFVDDVGLSVLSNDAKAILKSLRTEKYDQIFVDSELVLDSSVLELISRQDIVPVALSRYRGSHAGCIRKNKPQSELGVYYEKLAHFISDGVIFIDDHKKIIYMSDSLCAMSGIEKDEFLYRNVFDLFEGYAKNSLTAIGKCGEFSKDEIFLINESENIHVPVSIDYHELDDGTGILLVTDIRWRKEMEQVILDQNKKLKRLDKLKEDFIDNISHELRTPLTISKEAICLLSDRVLGALNESQSHFLDVALTNLGRLTNIINRLLEISRIKNEGLVANKKETQLGILINKVYDLYKEQSDKQGVVFSCECDVSCPFMIDFDKAVRVLSLIVENALKFSSVGDKISITGSSSDTDAVILIEDTGCGIPMDEIDNIFDSFHQVNRTFGPGEKGTGLGLSIVNGLLKVLDGCIDIESNEGKGSSFKITFPLNYDKISTEDR